MPFAIPDAAIGAIGASIVAATVSLTGLTVTKEQKISDLRQAWIDALRGELSELLEHAHAIQGAASAENRTRRELWSDVKENFAGINRVIASIELRLNPNEAAAKSILRCLRELEALIGSDSRIDFESMATIERRLVSASQPLLKEEWERVKRGEPTYRIAKHASWLGLVVLVCTLLYAGWTSPPVRAARGRKPKQIGKLRDGNDD
jgi:hypothetical protein